MARKKDNSDLHSIKLETGTVYQTEKGGTYYFRYQVNKERKCVSKHPSKFFISASALNRYSSSSSSSSSSSPEGAMSCSNSKTRLSYLCCFA